MVYTCSLPVYYNIYYLIYYIDLSLKVAVIREEGTNGDREMSAALFMAGFEVWDITVQDLLNETINIEHFRGLIFPGGFSYGGNLFNYLSRSNLINNSNNILLTVFTNYSLFRCTGFS